jgi:hypothetical protein
MAKQMSDVRYQMLEPTALPERRYLFTDICHPASVPRLYLKASCPRVDVLRRELNCLFGSGYVQRETPLEVLFAR